MTSNDQNYMIKSDEYATVILTNGILPSTITEDTYLTKGTYTVSSNLTIQAGVSLEVEAGSIINFDRRKTIIVNGTLKLNGTESETININHFMDNVNSGPFITINQTGIVEATYVNVENTANPTLTEYTTFIDNKGALKVNNSKATSPYNAYHDIISIGDIEIINSEIPKSITINQGSSNIIIKDNLVISEIKIALNTCDVNLLSNVKNNYGIDNQPKTIVLMGNPVGDVKLYKQNYSFPNDLIIPINTVFEVEAGTNMTFANSKRITVNGTLKLTGTENKRINLKHYLAYYSTIASITITSTGAFEATYANIENTANPNLVESTIFIDNKGLLKFNNSNATSSYYATHDIVSIGDIEVINSEIPRSIIINQGSHNVIVRDSLIKGEIRIALNACDVNLLSNVKNNYGVDNQSKIITLTGNPVSNVKLYNQDYLLANTISIPINTVFELEAGTNLKVFGSNAIDVVGTLNLSGSLNDSVVITNGTNGIYWGGIRVGQTGALIASNAEIRYAGNSNFYPIQNQGRLVMWNSIIVAGYDNKAIVYNTSDSEQILTNNSILGNVTSNIEINAQYNFWGHESGPRKRNPETGSYVGSGFTVSDNIYVEPFQTSFVKTSVENIILIKINELRHFGILGVNPSSGNFSKQFTDLNFSNQNIDLNFTRTYNSRDGKTNVFDIRNKLISTTKNNDTITYEYNVEGNRISKSDGNDTIKFIYEGNNIILEVDENNSKLSRNIYGLVLVSRIVDNDNGYYLYNGHGDVTTIIDEDGEILNTYEYDAWGVIVSETGDFDNPYRYVGYYYDTETSNYYLLSRYYNPEIARFISEDTYRGELNDPLSLNRYAYVNNNLMIYYDPNGEFAIPVVTGILGSIWGAGSTFVGDLWNSAVSGEWQLSSLETYLGNTIEGGLTGFGLGLCGPGCGALGNFAGNSINQLINTGEVDFVQSGISGVTTFVTAGMFGVGGPVTSTGLNYIKDYAVKGFVAGAVGDFTNQMLNNGLVRNDQGNLTGYSINQAMKTYNPVQTLKAGTVSAIMAPGAAKLSDMAIDKFGPSKYTVEINGKKVTIDKKSFDPNRVDPKTGKTNLELLKEGYAPIGHDGQEVQIHHIGQKDGAVREMQKSDHKLGDKNLHPKTGNGYRSQIDRGANNTWNRNYRTWRADNINYIPESVRGIGGIISSRTAIPNK